MNDTFYARTDSNSANNPALNLTGAPAVQITFIPETLGGGSGDLILEDGPGGFDPDTVVQIDGVNYNFTYSLSGTMPTQNSDGAQQVPDQFEGDPVSIVTIIDYPSAGETTRLAFLPDSNATQAEMDDFGNGAIDVQAVDTTPPPLPVCFAHDTAISTPRGEVLVQNLMVGDHVSVLDGAPMPVRWIGRSRKIWPSPDHGSRPVVIRAGAFGNGLPSKDLTVSPQHKLAMCGAHLEMDFGLDEALAPAIGLTRHSAVQVDRATPATTYYHIMLDHHALILAHGVASESFYPGPCAMNLLTPLQRLRVLQLVPALNTDPELGYGPMARPALNCSETRRLVAQGVIALIGSEPENQDAMLPAMMQA